MDVNELQKKSKDNTLLQLDYPKVHIIESEVPIEDVEAAYSHYKIYGEYDGYNPKAAIARDSFFDSADLNIVIVYKVDIDDNQTRIDCKAIVLERYKEKWQEFCEKWNIDKAWDGKLLTLSKYLLPFIIVHFDEEDKHLPIHIKMSAWAIKKDLIDSYDEVKKIKKSIFNRKKKSEQAFGRDLCWYKLNKEYKKRPEEIAKLWEEVFPEEIDHFTLEYMMNDPVTKKDFEEAIRKNGLKDQGLENSSKDVLLKKVKTGKLSQKYRSLFDETRIFYVSGKQADRHDYPPFLKTIRVAIKRMEDYIKESRNIVRGIQYKQKRMRDLLSFSSDSSKKYLR